MRFLAWNVGLATWLFLSAFALLHTPGSAAFTGLMAVLILTFGIAAPGLRGLRFVSAALALVLGWASLLLPDVSWAARLNNLLVAGAVLVIALVPGRSTSSQRKILWIAWRNPVPPPPPPGGGDGRAGPDAAGGGADGKGASAPRADRC